jgi:phage terminase small subunit
MKNELTDKQKRFCDEYLVDYNATQACIRAGYSAHSAHNEGCRMLTNPKIQKRLTEGKQKLASKLEISTERIRLELARIGMQDVRLFYKEDGSLIPIHELSDDAAAAIAGMEVEELTEFIDGQKIPIGVLKKIKRYDKVKALELLGKDLGMFNEGQQPITLNVTIE